MGRSWRSMADFEAFLDGGGIVEPVDEMPEEYRDQVFRFIELHANSELMGGLTDRDWIPKAPGLRRKMAMLTKTQEEIGHAHLLYMVAADVGVKSRQDMLQDLFAGAPRRGDAARLRRGHARAAGDAPRGARSLVVAKVAGSPPGRDLSGAEPLTEDAEAILAETFNPLMARLAVPLADVLAAEVAAQGESAGTPEYAEGFTAFAEKRKPNFVGDRGTPSGPS